MKCTAYNRFINILYDILLEIFLLSEELLLKTLNYNLTIRKSFPLLEVKEYVKFKGRYKTEVKYIFKDVWTFHPYIFIWAFDLLLLLFYFYFICWNLHIERLTLHSSGVLYSKVCMKQVLAVDNSFYLDIIGF